MSPFTWREHVESIVDLGDANQLFDPHALTPASIGRSKHELEVAWPLVRLLALSAAENEDILCLPWALPEPESRLKHMYTGNLIPRNEVFRSPERLTKYLERAVSNPEQGIFRNAGLSAEQCAVLVGEANDAFLSSGQPEIREALLDLDDAMRLRSVGVAANCLTGMSQIAGVAPPESDFAVAWARRDVAAAAEAVLADDALTRWLAGPFRHDTVERVCRWIVELAHGDPAFQPIATLAYQPPHLSAYPLEEPPAEGPHPLVHNWITMELLAMTMPSPYREEVEATCRDLFARGAKPEVYAQLMKVMPECAPAPKPEAEAERVRAPAPPAPRTR